jgi:hypothetical protein
MQRKLAYFAIIFLAAFAVAQQPPAPAPHGQSAQPAQSPDKIWSDLMDGNQRFVAGKLKPRAVVSIRESLTKSQYPKATVRLSLLRAKSRRTAQDIQSEALIQYTARIEPNSHRLRAVVTGQRSLTNQL